MRPNEDSSAPATKAKKRKRAKKPPRRTPWLLYGGMAASVCLLLLVAGMIWFFSRARGGGGEVGAAGPAREPQNGQPTSWVPPVKLSSADSAAWQVTADEAPKHAGLQSALPISPGVVESFTFAVSAGQAAVVLRTPAGDSFEWVRYDLRQREPAGRVPLGDAKGPADQALRPNETHSRGAAVSALSPSGDRIAVRDGHSRFIGVWSKDGRRVGTLRADAGRARIDWTGFAGEDRLWVLAGTQLRLRDVATDKEMAPLRDDVAGLPTLTPGGKWLVACAGRELLFLKAADGSRAGAVPLPEGWGGSKWPTCLAVDPSGRAVAVTLANERSDMLLGVWDLATGRLTDSLVQTYHLSQQRLTPGLQWAGERRLVCGSALVDIDRHIILCNQYLPHGALAPSGPGSPDGRQWIVRQFTDQEWARVEKKLPPAGAATRTYLTAAAQPEAVTGPMDAAAKAFLWHPGVAVRLVVADSVPKKYRARLAEACADVLAKEGYRLAPDAPVTVEAVIKLGAKTNGTGKRIPHDKLTDEMKRELRFNPGKAWYEITDVYDVSVQARVLADGRLALQTPNFGVFSTVERGAGEDAAWEKLTERGPDLNLPRLYLRDAEHKRLLLPKSFQPGVDGLLEPVVEGPQGTVKDGYALPEDG